MHLGIQKSAVHARTGGLGLQVFVLATPNPRRVIALERIHQTAPRSPWRYVSSDGVGGEMH